MNKNIIIVILLTFIITNALIQMNNSIESDGKDTKQKIKQNYDNEFIIYNHEYKHKNVFNEDLYLGTLYYYLYKKTQHKDYKSLSNNFLNKSALNNDYDSYYLLSQIFNDNKNVEIPLLITSIQKNNNPSSIYKIIENSKNNVIPYTLNSTIYNISEEQIKHNKRHIDTIKSNYKKDPYLSYQYGLYLLKNNKESKGISILKTASEQGISMATLTLAENSKGEQKIKYYIKAAKQRNPEAAFKAYRLLPKNNNLREKLLYYAAENNVIEAQYIVVKNILNKHKKDLSKISKKNQLKIIKYLSYSSNHLHKESSEILGDFYKWGFIVKPNKDLAIKYLEQAYLQGSISASLKLYIISDNLNDKIQYIKRAAELGEPYAQYEYSKYLSNEKDFSKWIKLSRQQGFVNAIRENAYLPEISFIYEKYNDMKEKNFNEDSISIATEKIIENILLPKKGENNVYK